MSRTGYRRDQLVDYRTAADGAWFPGGRYVGIVPGRPWDGPQGRVRVRTPAGNVLKLPLDGIRPQASATPLADALAEVDKTQAEARAQMPDGTLGDGFPHGGEVRALRALAEQVRVHLAGCGEACTAPVHAKLTQAVGEWSGKVEAHAARTELDAIGALDAIQDIVSEGGPGAVVDGYTAIQRLERIAAALRDAGRAVPHVPDDVQDPEPAEDVESRDRVAARLLDAGWLVPAGVERVLQDARQCGSATVTEATRLVATVRYDKDTGKFSLAERGPRYIARFTPEAWVNDQAVEADAQGPREWDCTRYAQGRPAYLADMAKVHGALDSPQGTLDACDWFKDDPAAPDWVRAWAGPCTIRIRLEAGP